MSRTSRALRTLATLTLLTATVLAGCGGVYAARVEGSSVRVVFPNQATLTVVPGAGDRAEATVTPAPQPSNFSIHAGSNEPVRGELRPVPE